MQIYYDVTLEDKIINYIFIALNKKIKQLILKKNCKIKNYRIIHYIFLKKYDQINSNIKLNHNLLLLSQIKSTSCLTMNFLMCKFMTQLSLNYLGFRLDWLFTNASVVAKKTKFYNLFFIFLKSRHTKFLNLQKDELYNLYLQLSLLKSPLLLIKAAQTVVSKTLIKRHRSVFKKIKYLIRFWFFLILKIRVVKGYSIFFKGKLGRKGSIRKKKIFFKEGVTSFTNKSLRINYKNFIFWTETGVVGANISIFF